MAKASAAQSHPLSLRTPGLRGLEGLFPFLQSLCAMQEGSGWDSRLSVVAQSSAHGTRAEPWHSRMVEIPGQELG